MNWLPLTEALKQFRHARHEVTPFCRRPRGGRLPFTHPQFRSLERDQHRILVDPHRLRQTYLKQYHDFIDQPDSVPAATPASTTSTDHQRTYATALACLPQHRTRRRGTE
ncbi:MAG: hypothetical protein R3C02_04825 [Planctomycetaceae bacterium]